MAKTLDEFRQTREWYPNGFPEMEIDEPAFVYDLSCHIFTDKDGNNPYLVIHNQQWSNKPLEELEQILYEQFYLTEVAHAGS